MRAGLRVTLALLPLLAGCGPGADEPGSASTSLGAGTEWRAVGAWHGRGDRQTESFDVTTGALRIAWEGRNETTPEAGRIRVTLHSAISGRPLETVADAHGSRGDTAYVATEPRVAYLLIESEALDWRVTLEEGVRGDLGAPRRE